ncbi:hypothetical protein RFI_30068 [Reticulomyxa filosa]|uniref:Sulfatase N-terminal domain-containing protein n=1 Tax=Reticulomyxa filosa TaxID=46433 RepID=X6M0B2_RETFI|nr:hypothetical protein RFI_30068 [Reticulomyxa filosa]|eukprot:ETO07324.1 hypothetical protein RFI_30068 [Reticulomyxa filosa]
MTLQFSKCASCLLFALFVVTTNGAPNILFILTDDVGWNDVSFHRSTLIETPHLDELAETGLLLNNYYVQPVCTPTRSAFLSGKYPIRHGLQHHVILPGAPYGLDLDEYLLSQYLKEDSTHAYHTHLVGKWHLGYFDIRYTPIYRYFDTFYGYYMDMQDYYTHQRDHYNSGIDFRNGTFPIASFPKEYSTFVYGNVTKDLLLHYAKAHQQGKDTKPFFIFLAYQSVHVPKQYEHKISDTDTRIMAAMMSTLDDSIGELMQVLRHTKLWEDTLVIFSNDNGAGHFEDGVSNFPLRGGKNTLWEGGVRSLGLINGGALNSHRRGQQSDALFHITDWFPTLVQWTNPSALLDQHDPVKEKILQMDGISQYEMIQFGTQSVDNGSRREILINVDPIRLPECESHYHANSSNLDQFICVGAIRYEKWKLIVGKQANVDLFHSVHSKRGWNPRSEFNTFQPTVKCNENFPNTCTENRWGHGCLFDLEKDPCEFTDLSDQFPQMYHMLYQKLLQYSREMKPPLQLSHGESRQHANPQNFNGFWSPWIGPCSGYGNTTCANVVVNRSRVSITRARVPTSQFHHATPTLSTTAGNRATDNSGSAVQLRSLPMWQFIACAIVVNGFVMWLVISYFCFKRR